MLTAPVLLASVLLQLMAAIAALRLIKVTQRNVCWILISVALFLMAIRRLNPLYHQIVLDPSYPVDLGNEMIGLVLSALMLLGVLGIRPLFVKFITTETNRKLQLERIQALLQLNQMTAASLQEITDFALEEAVCLTQSTIGYLAFVNEDESIMTMHSWSKSAMAECAVTEKPIVYPVASTGLWGEAIRQRRSIITNEYAQPNPLKKGCPQGHVHIKRHMNVPIFVGTHIVLVAGVGNKTEPYIEDDVQQLTLLMEGMWRLIERLRANEALYNEKANLDAVFESSPVAMMVLDMSLNIVRINAAAVSLCGGDIVLTGHDQPGPILRCIHHAQDPRGCGFSPMCKTCPLRNGIQPLLTQGKRMHSVEMPLEILREGSTHPVWVKVGAEPLQFNGHPHVCVAVEDITLRKQAEAASHALNLELEQRVFDRTAELAATNQQLAGENEARQRVEAALRMRNEELKEFAYTVSHDLKAPLRGIAGYSDELNRRHRTGMSDRALFCIDQILTATRNLDHLIEDLLRYSRMDAEIPKITDIDLRKLIESILHDRDLIIAKQGTNVTLNIPDMKLRGWERGLIQVFSNLIDNALKYSRKSVQPQLTITALEHHHAYRVMVTDNGIGFDMKYHDRIFGLFNRLVRSDEFEGTGAGLAIVKKLVEKLDGTIHAESTLGQGSTFIVELPQHPPERTLV